MYSTGQFSGWPGATTPVLLGPQWVPQGVTTSGSPGLEWGRINGVCGWRWGSLSENLSLGAPTGASV